MIVSAMIHNSGTGPPFPWIAIVLWLFEHDLRANASLVCRKGKAAVPERMEHGRPFAILVAGGFLIWRCTMSYALFEDDERLTRSFPTEQDVWAAAERAGLVDVGSDGTKKLDDRLEIRRCEATPDETIDPGSDFVFP
jgi:hypothetical protein